MESLFLQMAISHCRASMKHPSDEKSNVVMSVQDLEEGSGSTSLTSSTRSAQSVRFADEVVVILPDEQPMTREEIKAAFYRVGVLGNGISLCDWVLFIS